MAAIALPLTIRRPPVMQKHIVRPEHRLRGCAVLGRAEPGGAACSGDELSCFPNDSGASVRSPSAVGKGRPSAPVAASSSRCGRRIPR